MCLGHYYIVFGDKGGCYGTIVLESSFVGQWGLAYCSMSYSLINPLLLCSGSVCSAVLQDVQSLYNSTWTMDVSDEFHKSLISSLRLILARWRGGINSIHTYSLAFSLAHALVH